MNVKLLVIQGRPAGKVMRFGPGDYFFGRGPECHLRFNSDWVSRQHCRLHVSSTQAILRDLGSRNGTLLNGVLLNGDHVLAEKDQIQIGPVVFEVILDEGPGGASSSTTLHPPEGVEPGRISEKTETTTALPRLLDEE
jgi:pSer/pThr/pTyr-binding forkhead associated (FHA) protein